MSINVPLKLSSDEPPPPTRRVVTPDKSGLAMEYADYVMRHVNEKLRKVLLVAPINEATFAAVFFALTYLGDLNKRPITLVLDTFGGDITAGLAMHDCITNIKQSVPVDILVTGACMSMGTVILQSARKRIATQHTTFMMHQLRGTNQGELGEMRDLHRHMEDMQRILNKIIVDRSGMSQKQLTKLIERRDCYISAEEALDINLIDEIEK